MLEQIKTIDIFVISQLICKSKKKSFPFEYYHSFQYEKINRYKKHVYESYPRLLFCHYNTHTHTSYLLQLKNCVTHKFGCCGFAFTSDFLFSIDVCCGSLLLLWHGCWCIGAISIPQVQISICFISLFYQKTVMPNFHRFPKP